MAINRRQFASSSFAGAAAAGLAVAGPPQKAVGAEPAARRPNPIAVSSYSFWRYNDATKLPIERCLDIASEMGFDGFEALHVQMQDESNSYCQKLKRRAFVHGMPLCGFSTHQGFVFPDATERKKILTTHGDVCSWLMRWAFPPCESIQAVGERPRVLMS